MFKKDKDFEKFKSKIPSKATEISGFLKLIFIAVFAFGIIMFVPMILMSSFDSGNFGFMIFFVIVIIALKYFFPYFSENQDKNKKSIKIKDPVRMIYDFAKNSELREFDIFGQRIENYDFTDLIREKSEVKKSIKWEIDPLSRMKLNFIDQKISEYKAKNPLNPEEKMIEFLFDFEFRKRTNEILKIENEIFSKELTQNPGFIFLKIFLFAIFWFIGIFVLISIIKNFTSEFWVVTLIFLYFTLIIIGPFIVAKWNQKPQKIFEKYRFHTGRWLLLEDFMQKYFSKQGTFSKISTKNSLLFELLINKISENFTIRKNLLEKIENIFNWIFSGMSYNFEILEEDLKTEKQRILQNAIWSKEIIWKWATNEAELHKNIIKNIDENNIFELQKNRLDLLVDNLENIWKPQ